MDRNSKQDSLLLKNMTFLIQSSPNRLSIEDKVILKQTFKLVSEQLSEEDNISIIVYSRINGVALKKNIFHRLEKLIHILENYKSSIKELHEDGIELAYSYAYC